MLARLNDFKTCSPKKLEVIEERKEILTDAERFCDCRNKVIETFEDSFFLFKIDFKKKSQMYQIGLVLIEQLLIR